MMLDTCDLTRARGVLADIKDHSDREAVIACLTILGESPDHAECKSALDLLEVLMVCAQCRRPIRAGQTYGADGDGNLAHKPRCPA